MYKKSVMHVRSCCFANVNLLLFCRSCSRRRRRCSSSLLFLTVQVQEVPNEEFEGGQLVPGPVLRINCSEAVQFTKPVTIQLPISLHEQQVLTQGPTTCRVRVLFLKSDDGPKRWIEITDDLVKPASFDGKFVNIHVERFSG